MRNFISIILSTFIIFSFQNIYAEGEEALLADIDRLNTLMEGYEALMQINIADQLAAITGTTELGNFLNNKAEQEARAWSPSEWAQVVSGGNASRYKQLLADYQKAHPTLSTSEAAEGMSSENATDYQQKVETNQAASSQATYAFNNTNAHLETINQLSEKINEESDTKHIQDLTARMNAEIAYLQVEIIKGIAVMNEQMAQQQATEIHERTEAAKFNKIPE